MFEPIEKPRVFGVPCGVDFALAVKNGIMTRMATQPPERLARTVIFTNNSRMKRALTTAFDDGATHFIPRIRLVTELEHDLRFAQLPKAMSGMRLRLELAQLVTRFLDANPAFAERSAIFDLADSLAKLMGEMRDESVSLEVLKTLDVRDESGHWGNALAFLSLVREFYDHGDSSHYLSEERLGDVVNGFGALWQENPPDHPILVVGSTGSRGTTARFMDLVSKLPQGAVVQPGVDFDMPADVWAQIRDNRTIDHPQERVVRFVTRLGLQQSDIAPFSGDVPANTSRNQLISLTLRPAPVTDQWMRDGPNLAGVTEACRQMQLIEAPDPRREANAIALLLREAAGRGKRVALVTPDRTLARQVTTALDRWNIEPEDSAGVPLSQTAPARLIRMILAQIGRQISTSALLAILRHPLVASGADPAAKIGRGYHSLWAQQIEVRFRKNEVLVPTRAALLSWAKSNAAAGLSEDSRVEWASWVADFVDAAQSLGSRALIEHLDHCVSQTEMLVIGPESGSTDKFWDGLDGRQMKRFVDDFRQEAAYGGPLLPREFDALFRTMLAPSMSRDPSPKHPDVLIWGTQEARSIRADLVVLGGLNDGIWPSQPAPDPWFSRQMRKDAGLLLPDQMIGLSAHDYQQAIGAKEVVLSRSVRDNEAETIPSRWVSRLTNLLSGMSDEGRTCLEDMRARGQVWLTYAQALDRPPEGFASCPPAGRPSPCPPVSTRPKRLSVTEIERLIGDPYAIYAKHILGLAKLPPLVGGNTALTRGTALHKVMEMFVLGMRAGESRAEAISRILQLAETVFEELSPQTTDHRLWLAQIRRIAPRLVTREQARFRQGSARHLEVSGAFETKTPQFKLVCKADRIDLLGSGTFHIYDYKSGQVPSEKAAKTHRIQLLLEAMMLSSQGFDGVEAGEVSGVTYLSLANELVERHLPVDVAAVEEVEAKFKQLVENYNDPRQGYTARRHPGFMTYESDFAQLSRFLEWGDADEVQSVEVGSPETGETGEHLL